jgi:hypothetical protein
MIEWDLFNLFASGDKIALTRDNWLYIIVPQFKRKISLLSADIKKELLTKLSFLMPP